MDFWKEDHYTWIYTQVVARSRELRKVLLDSGLFPIQ